MNIFDILKNLYTNTKSDWILEIDDKDIKPFLIQLWLIMNKDPQIQNVARWLDKYVFTLPPKMYLSLAWSIIPKVNKAPFVKYIKKIKDQNDSEFDFILLKVKAHLELCQSDYNLSKEMLLDIIKKDMYSWFSFYAVPEEYYNKYKVKKLPQQVQSLSTNSLLNFI